MRRRALFTPLPVEPHGERIAAALDDLAFTGAAPVFGAPLVILAFCNRSGSNLLSEYLRSVDGLGGFREMLNWKQVLNRAEAGDITGFPDYMRHLVDEFGGEAGFGIKASHSQIAMLIRWNILAMFPSVKVIHIRRQDVVAQAVSLHFALSTGTWTSSQDSGAPPVVDYDYDALCSRMAQVFESNTKIELVCAAAGLERHTIIYEQLIGRPNPAMRGALSFLGLDAATWMLPRKTKMNKQRSPAKAAMVERFRAELAAQILA